MYQNQAISRTQARRDASSIFLAKVFNWMAGGLALTGVVAFYAMSSGLTEKIVQGPMFIGLILFELGLVFFLSARINKIQASTAAALFIGYSGLNGLTLSAVCMSYTSESVVGTLFITAGMFGAMAVYGMVTKKDLSGWGSFLFMGLVGIIIASVVNMFLGSSNLHWAISFLGVLIFTGLTAYDVQKIKKMGEDGILEQGAEMIKKGAIMGALTLYLDFINLFLMLLRFFGTSRD
ncbi:MAG: Bax inhibitor-1/YccA family protein [Desulfotalea sp.]